MTEREKAVVMAYTGVVTLMGDKLGEFYKYAEELLGRPVHTHELPKLSSELKRLSFPDFCVICKTESEPVIHGKWEPVWKDIFCISHFKCSVCGHKEKKSGWAYCHCGAKMDL